MYNVPTKISGTLGWMEKEPLILTLCFFMILVLSNPEVRIIMFMDRRDWMQAGR